jgi:hypothetical protein
MGYGNDSRKRNTNTSAWPGFPSMPNRVPGLKGGNIDAFTNVKHRHVLQTAQPASGWILSLTNFSYTEVVEDLTSSLTGSIRLKKPEDASLKSTQRKRR